MACTFPTEDFKRSPLRIIFALFLSFAFTSYSQVDTHFNLDWKLFLSTYTKNNDQWVCGVDISASDSTNRHLAIRMDLLKNWKTQDSFNLIVTLDTTKTYAQMSGTRPFEAMKYVSQEEGVTLFLAVPEKFEYTLSNGMTGVTWQFEYANVILPPKWKKHQKYFQVFYGK